MPIQDSRYQIDLAALESPSGGERSTDEAPSRER